VSPDRAVVGDEGVERAMKRVATLGEGYISMAVPAEEMKRRLALIDKYASAAGRDMSNFEVAIHGMVNINNDQRAAYEESKYYFNNYYTPGYPSEELLGMWLAHGPPEECARLIQGWIDMGFTTPVLRFTSRNQLGQIERFIQDVLPLLRLK
jgi:alkanesulfonate monooxygenase